MEGVRVRGDAGRRGQLHHDLQHGEPGSDGDPHRRIDRRRARADPERRRPPDPSVRGLADHPRARGRGRMQHPVRRPSEDGGVSGDRGEPARLPVLRARLQGDGLPDRPHRREDRDWAPPRRDPQPGDGQDARLLRADPRLHRHEDPAVAVRQVPDRRPPHRDVDEEHGGGDGDRTDVRGIPPESRAISRDRPRRLGVVALDGRRLAP